MTTGFRIRHAPIADVVALLPLEPVVRELLPGGVLRGREYEALNPTRADKHTGSLKVNVNTGKWAEFAAGGAKGASGGDVVSLYAYLKGLNNGQAADALDQLYGLGLSDEAAGQHLRLLNPPKATSKPATKSRADRLKETHGFIPVIPDDAATLPAKPDIYLKADSVFSYAVGGKLLFFVLRYEARGDKRKVFYPLTLWQNRATGKYEWHSVEYQAELKPLYGHDLLAAHPDVSVLVVSGEKCADAANGFFEANGWPYVAVTWPGGDKAAGKIDLAPLHGRNLIFWGDNDRSSCDAMTVICTKTGGVILPLPGDAKIKGWDCADALAEGISLSDYVQAHLAEATRPAANDNPTPPEAVENQGEAERPTIRLQPGNRPDRLTRAWEALRLFGGLYQRGGCVVRAASYDNQAEEKLSGLPGKAEVEIPDGTVHIGMLTPPTLALFVDKSANVVRPGKKASDWQPADFPEKDCKAMLGLVDMSGLRHLKGIISSPTIRPDGSLLASPGYDVQTGLLFNDFGVDFGLCKLAEASLTREDAQEALKELGWLISEFPFVDEDIAHDAGAESGSQKTASKSVALAAMLTAVVRPVLPSAPLFVFSAPAAGAGKGLLARLATYLSTGREPAMISYHAEDEKEFRKEGAALLMHGFSAVVLDNVNGRLKSDWLCSVLSQPEKTDRVLGLSKEITSPTNCLWLATGNNIRPEGDLIRRTLFCRIKPETARPDERVFNIDPIAALMRDRPKYVRAALTVLLAYQQNKRDDGFVDIIGEDGAPKTIRLTPYGSFEQWSALVRAALIWAGEIDPLQQRKALEAGDPERRTLRRVLLAMYQSGVKEKFSAKGLIDTAKDKPDLQEALSDVCAAREGNLSSHRLGNYLSKYKDRAEECEEAGTLRVIEAGSRSNKTYYRVERVDTAQVGTARNDGLSLRGEL